jgi:hypothetical protein
VVIALSSVAAAGIAKAGQFAVSVDWAMAETVTLKGMVVKPAEVVAHLQVFPMLLWRAFRTSLYVVALH